MKRCGAILFFIFSLMLTGKWLITYSEYEKSGQVRQERSEWKGYIKKGQDSKPGPLKKISQEDKKYLTSPAPSNERSPSALSNEKNSPKRNKNIIGNQKVLEQELTLTNNPRSDWQEIFVERMLSTQPPNTKVFIQHKGQAYIVRSSDARSVEEVLISFKKEDKSISSYMAWVDSETGSLIRTWARTQGHNFRSKGPRLAPSGTL